jgi:hypothetical protein
VGHIPRAPDLAPLETRDPTPTHSVSRHNRPLISTPEGDPRLDRVRPPTKYEFCNNYSVTSTRQCLFNHTRTPSIINDLQTRSARQWPSNCAIYVHTYTYIMTCTKCSTWNIVRTIERGEPEARKLFLPANPSPW